MKDENKGQEYRSKIRKAKLIYIWEGIKKQEKKDSIMKIQRKDKGNL